MSWIESGFLVVESQGVFAPETLNPNSSDDVYSRRWTSEEHILDVSLAPTSAWLRTNPLHDGNIPDEYEATVCVELRDAGDEDGDTSDYRWEDILDGPVSYEEALKAVKHYIANVNPDEEVTRFD